jgi:tetratricopeptide (TPR) repeat protein
LLLIGLLLGAAGGGAAFWYKRQEKQRETDEAIAKHLTRARTAFAASTPGHWKQAGDAATKVLDLAPKHPQALELGAEAYLISGLDDSVAAVRDIKKGRDLLARARAAAVTGPAIERAQALSNLTVNQPDSALTKLQPMFDKAPKDGRLALYVGWAHAQRGDAESAIKAFDVAVESAQLQLAALYGRGRAKLAAANLEGARTDFAAILDANKDHVGAQVGTAAAKPASEAQQQEADLRAIINLKDAAAKSPRAITWANILVADLARRAGRLDDARGSFNAALKLEPHNIAALTGLAEVELRDDKLDVAATTITKVLTQSPNDVRAQLVAAEISIKQNKLADAAARIKALSERTPPPPIAEQARLKLVIGRLLDVQKDDAAAADAYVEAARLAGDRDLEPTLLAVAKLGLLADQAATDDPAKAAELRGKADQLLGSLAANAEKDPQLALTLGTAYLQTNDAGKAETWLRRTLEARPNDTEAQFQLAKALARLGKHAEAIDGLKKALDLDPQRTEIGLELARTYEASARDADALALYDKLLAITKEPSVELRARAGRFYARTQKFEQAGEQGAKILEAQAGHPTGLFLKAEGLLAKAGTDRIKTDVARKLFAQAAEAERDAQFLDGHGRACEALAKDDGSGAVDFAMQDHAIRAYTAAIELDPKMRNPHAGLGRLYVARREFAKAVPPLRVAYEMKHTAETAHDLGVAHKEQQQHKLAVEWFRTAIKIESTADSNYQLAETFQHPDYNNPREAMKALAIATRLAEAEERKASGRPVVEWLTEAYGDLGYLYLGEGRDREAADAWNLYVGRDPPPSERLKEVQTKLATELQRYNRRQE